MDMAGPSPSDIPRVMFRLRPDISMAENTLENDAHVSQEMPTVWALSPLWGIPGGSQLLPVLGVMVIHEELQESVRRSTVPPKSWEDVGWGTPCPFFLGNGIPVPTCPAITSCSSQSPALGMLQVGSGQQFLCLRAHGPPEDPGLALLGRLLHDRVCPESRTGKTGAQQAPS